MLPPSFVGTGRPDPGGGKPVGGIVYDKNIVDIFADGRRSYFDVTPLLKETSINMTSVSGVEPPEAQVLPV